jgi:hypothetical protein
MDVGEEGVGINQEGKVVTRDGKVDWRWLEGWNFLLCEYTQTLKYMVN